MDSNTKQDSSGRSEFEDGLGSGDFVLLTVNIKNIEPIDRNSPYGVLLTKSVYICIHLYPFFTVVYICLHLFTFVYICLHLFTFVYICLHLFTFVYICLHLFTFV
jgi:hypothetical protein